MTDALDKHVRIINNEKETTKNAYVKHKDDNEFRKNHTEYDKQYYQEHKQTFLQSKKKIDIKMILNIKPK